MRSRTDRQKLAKLAAVVNKALLEIQEILKPETSEFEQIEGALNKVFRKPEPDETQKIMYLSKRDIAAKLPEDYSPYLVGRYLTGAGYGRKGLNFAVCKA